MSFRNFIIFLNDLNLIKLRARDKGLRGLTIDLVGRVWIVAPIARKWSLKSIEKEMFSEN